MSNTNLTIHKNTTSRFTPAITLSTSLPLTPSHPTTAPSSSSSSPNSAIFSQEASASSPFRYYLPHISTAVTPVYTCNETYACNLSLSSPGMKIDEVGLFYHYVPGASTEIGDVYTHDTEFGTVESLVHCPFQLEKLETAEQNPLQEWEEPVSVIEKSQTPLEIKSPLSYIRRFDFPYRSDMKRKLTLGVGVDLGSYTAGEVSDARRATLNVDAGKGKRQRRRLRKDRERVPETMGDVAVKVGRMLRRLRLG